MLATGCISFGTRSNEVLILDRVIESFPIDPRNRTCQLWVDIFLDNHGGSEQTLFVLHRGSLIGENVTMDAWTRVSSCAWRKRVVRKHEQFDPIVVGDNRVVVADKV